jgi:hypothetical protein
VTLRRLVVSRIGLVSAIVPTRDRAELLVEQLEAFAAQTYPGALADRIPVRLVEAMARAAEHADIIQGKDRFVHRGSDRIDTTAISETEGLNDGTAVPVLYRDFRSDGMPRNARENLQGWTRIVRYGPRWILSHRGREELAKEAGWLIGRMVGSIRQRVVYL